MRNVVLGVILLIVAQVAQHYIDHKIRSYCQHHKAAYEIMLTSDAMSFVQSGGDPIGYRNYFKWVYARWINDPKRNIFEKLLFWRCGFIYDATNPPDEYQYPLKV